MKILDVLRYSKSRFLNQNLGHEFDIDSSLDTLSLLEFNRKISVPLVTIVIPTRNKHALLKNCIDSIYRFTETFPFEIVVIDNDSNEPETIKYLESADRFRVLKVPGKFNYSKICNMAAEIALGDYIVFLNNDTEILSANWLHFLVNHAMISDVGVVGALLFFPDGAIQHAGLSLGSRGIASHAFSGQSIDEVYPSGFSCRKVSAVTFACACISREKFRLLGGMNEKLAVGLNDVDFCLRSSKSGLQNVLCSEVRLIHLESQTRPKAISPKGFLQALRDVWVFFSFWNWRDLKESYLVEMTKPFHHK